MRENKIGPQQRHLMGIEMAVLSSACSIWLLQEVLCWVPGGICLLGQFCPDDLGLRSSWINLAV